MSYPCTGPQTVCVSMNFPPSTILASFAQPDFVQAAIKMIIRINRIRPRMIPQRANFFFLSNSYMEKIHRIKIP